MRTLIVAHGFPPQSQGGAELCAEAHALTIARDYGDDVLVIAREDDRSRAEYAVRRERRDGLSIAWINNTYASTRSVAETYDNPAITAAAAALVDEFVPDVAHIHHLTGLSTGIVPLLAGRSVPCLYTLHDYWLICHRGQLLDQHLRVCAGPEPDGCGDCLGLAGAAPASIHRAAAAVRAVERQLPDPAARALHGAATRVAGLLARNASDDGPARARLLHMQAICRDIAKFVSPSHAVRDRFVTFGVPADRIALIAYGIAAAKPMPAAVSSARLRIGFIGSLMVSKGVDVLLEAFAMLPPGVATVEIFGAPAAYHGDDGYRETLAPLLARDGVRQRGVVPHADIATAFSALDVLVVPSIWPENAPLVVHEAFQHGVPVVASRVGGLPEMVTDGVNGMLVEPRDAVDLARALNRLATEPGLLARLRAGIPDVPALPVQIALVRAEADAAITAARVARAATTTSTPVAAPPAAIAAIVINYGAPDETLIAVRALAASRRQLDRIIVVDNDPLRACADLIRDLPVPVVYQTAGRNLGFSGGVNLGIAEARRLGASHVLLVNSDVVLPPDCVGVLERALAASPSAGVAAPLLLSRSTPDRVASFGISYDSGTARMRQLGHGDRTDELAGPSVGVVDAASGAVMLISLATVDRIGDFDESYFFSFEEIEFCLRARRAGIATIVTRDAVAFHAGGRSMGEDSPRRLYFAARNHLKLATAGGGGLRSAPRAALVVGYNVAHAVRAPGGSLVQRLGAVTSGVRDFWRGRGGDRQS